MKIISKSSTKCIEKKILTEGVFSSQKPTERSECTILIDSIKFSESSTDAKKLDSDYLNPFFEKDKFVIGNASSEVDECVERIIETMFITEESLARITLDNVEERSVVIDFRIILTACDYFKPIWEWSVKEKYDTALSYKETGVSLYKSKRIADAFKKFSRACKILITLEPLEDVDMEEYLRIDTDNLRKILYNNMAECHLMRKNYDYAVLLCDKVIRRDENNVKAIYRRAVAQENLRDYEKALEHMDKVVALEPNNNLAKEKAAFYKKKVDEAKKRYDNIVRKMFNV